MGRLVLGGDGDTRSDCHHASPWQPHQNHLHILYHDDDADDVDDNGGDVDDA